MSSRRRNPRRPFGLESLENRRLMTIYDDVYIFNSTLAISPPADQDNTAVVSYSGGKVQIGLNGESVTYELSDFNNILYNGGNGKDNFRNNTGIFCTAYGNQGSDTLIGGWGTDCLIGGVYAAQQVVEPDTSPNFLYGRGGDDMLHGAAGNDLLSGGPGDDTLKGWEGNDVFKGGPDDDTYSYGWTGVTRYLQGFDKIDDADGNNTLDFMDWDPDVHIDLANGAAQWVSSGRLSINLGSSAITNCYGGSGNDVIRGNALDNYLTGGLGNDVLEGRGGNDLLSGDWYDDRYVYNGTNLGQDTIRSSHGTDTLDLRTLPKGAQVDLARADMQTVSDSGLSLLISMTGGIDNVWGTRQNDALRGNDQNNGLWGGAGNDVLEGRGGDDLLSGGTGDDIYWYSGHDLGKDRLTDHHQEGSQNRLDLIGLTSAAHVDLARAAVQTIATGTQLELLTADAIDNVAGTRYADVIKGNSLDNVLWGSGGNDTLYGRGGVDTLWGGSGNDGLFGGEEVDILNGGANADRFISSQQDVRNDIEYGVDAFIDFMAGDKDFTDAEIERIDLHVLRKLHSIGISQLTTASNQPIRFLRETSAGAWLGSNDANGYITLYDLAFRANVVEDITDKLMTDLALGVYDQIYSL